MGLRDLQRCIWWKPPDGCRAHLHRSRQTAQVVGPWLRGRLRSKTRQAAQVYLRENADTPATRIVERNGKTYEQAATRGFFAAGAGPRLPKTSYIRPYIGRKIKIPATYLIAGFPYCT